MRSREWMVKEIKTSSRSRRLSNCNGCLLTFCSIPKLIPFQTKHALVMFFVKLIILVSDVLLKHDIHLSPTELLSLWRKHSSEEKGG